MQLANYTEIRKLFYPGGLARDFSATFLSRVAMAVVSSHGLASLSRQHCAHAEDSRLCLDGQWLEETHEIKKSLDFITSDLCGIEGFNVTLRQLLK